MACADVEVLTDGEYDDSVGDCEAITEVTLVSPGADPLDKLYPTELKVPVIDPSLGSFKISTLLVLGLRNLANKMSFAITPLGLVCPL